MVPIRNPEREPMDTTQEVQRMMEQECVSLGIKRYQRALLRGEAESRPGIRLIKEGVEVFAPVIEQWRDDALAGKASSNANLAHFLSQEGLDAETVAYVVCRSVINAFAQRLKLTAVAMGITSLLEDTVNHEALRVASPRLYKLLQRKIEGSNSPGYRHVVLLRQQKYAGVKTIRWGKADKLRLGALLVNMAAQTTGMFDVVRQPGSRNSAGKKAKSTRETPYHIVPTARTVEWLSKSHSRCEVMNPYFMPMVCRPLPWVGPKGGGYLTPRMQYPLVKTTSRSFLEELSSIEMPMVLKAVNALQDTAWRVNAGVYRVLTQVWDSGGNLGKLPTSQVLDVPPRSFTDEDAALKSEAFMDWKKAAAAVHDSNAHSISKRMAMQQKLWVAERMQQFGQFYFAHALDFRGRAYAVGSFLNPQGDDSSKALLEFAEGKALGDNGAFWLAVHGANNFGVDKVSFGERVQWVHDNQDAILESAFNPIDGTQWWASADKPWQFLAFCFEWAGVVAHHSAGRPIEEYVSHLPVGLDGACNGLQNYSAMLRDEVGGAATNLVPSEVPSDIYTEVKVEAERIIEAAALEGDELAQKWHGQLTRSLTKRNTMTVPYSVTEFGMRDQLMQEFRKMAQEDPSCPEVVRSATMQDAAFLAKVNYEAIGKVVIAARAAMDWLKEVAAVVASDDLPVYWTAPSGFPVLQNYRMLEGVRVQVTVAGREYRLMLETSGTAMNKRKQKSGISPNFVHALDAAHLVRTVSKCVDRGVTAFCMVHDSYGTHAADTETMAQTLREAFVEQYTPDVLGQFREQLASRLPAELAAKLPPTPAFGQLNLNDVLNSDYFFA